MGDGGQALFHLFFHGIDKEHEGRRFTAFKVGRGIFLGHAGGEGAEFFAKVREAPRNLLAQIPGLVLVDLPESDLCCGAAGTYNLTEPEMAERLGRRKFKNILDTGARVVAAANAGCLLQIAREARTQGEKLAIVHPMDLLDKSYRGETIEF